MPPGDKRQMAGARGNENTQALLRHVTQALQSQGPFTGWRAGVTIQERGMKIYQMISSLRLIQPHVKVQSIFQAAVAFEEKTFKGAREKADYERECTEKLTSIRDSRERHANQMQGELAQQAGAHAGAQNHIRPPYPPQLQAQMQASPIPMQQHAMRMNTPNQQATMQQQALLQNQQQQRRGGLREDINMLPAPEFEQIRLIAEKMAMNTPPEDLEKIKMNLQNMSPEQRQSLASKGVEPLTYFFRTQALAEFRRQKRAKMEMAARAQGAAPDSGAGMGDPMANTQRRMGQNMMGHQGNGQFAGNGQQGYDPNFMAGVAVDHIQGQQADGLRSQEAGQLVVPANPPQGVSQQQFGAQQTNLSQQPGQNNDPNVSRAASNPKNVSQHQLQNAQNSQHAGQMQSQTPAQARAQVAANAQMSLSSQAGQANPQIPQQPQRSPAVSMMGNQTPQQQLNAQGRPPSTAPPMGHQHPGQQGMPGQTAPPNSRPQIPPNLPANLHEQLAQMPPERANALLASLQRHNFTNNQSMARTPSQASLGVQQTPPQPGQAAQRTPVPMQQQLSDMGGLPQGQSFQNSPMHMQQRPPQQRQQMNQPQNDALRLQFLRQQNGGMEMSEEQIQEMDRVPFPHAMLNANANMTPPPQHVKTWGQLKQWASQNPHVFGGVDLPKLLSLQRIHFAQSLNAQKREAARNASQAGQSQAEAFASMQGQQARPPFQQQNFQPGQNPAQRPPMNMPPMRPVTANEVQIARQRLGPQAQNFTDDHIKFIVQKNRQKQYWDARNAAAAQGFVPKPGNQVQPPQTAPQQPTIPATQQNAAQANLQNQTPKTAAAKPQPPATGKNARAQNAKPPQKNNLKRPNSDDVVEVQNPDRQQATQHPATATNSQATQPTTAPAAAKPGIPQYTREQLAAMTSQQRAQIEAHIRRQQAQTKQQVTKANAEEAWSRLPDNIKKIYAGMVQNSTKLEPVSMTPEQRTSMAQQLRESTDMLSRMDALVQFWARVPGHEKSVHALLSMRMQLMNQFKGPEWTLVDQFTVTPDALNSIVNYLKKYFSTMISRVQGSRQNQTAAAAPKPQGNQPGAKPETTQTSIPLNASNLQQLQQQEEAKQRAKRIQDQGVPAAPTSLQPPFPIGAASPQGVPQAYGPTDLTQAKLKIPPTKKRKQNNSTPISAQKEQAPPKPTPTPQPAKQAVPDPKKTPSSSGGPFRCENAECLHRTEGFYSQVALDKHIEDSHKVEEEPTNALEYAIESYRIGLGFDKSGSGDKSGVQESKKQVPTAPEMQRVVSKASATPKVKAEGTTPVTAGSVMGRRASQLGGKTSSPASNLLRTPQPSTFKGPGSVSAKPTPTKDGKKDAAKSTGGVGSPEGVAAPDLWADCPITFDAIRDAFSCLGEPGLPGLFADPADELPQPSDPFLQMQAKDTPESTDTGVNTQTPKDSDISKDDDLDINIGGNDDKWIPMDWVDLTGDLEGGLLMQDPFDEMDWDTIDLKEVEGDSNDVNMPVYSI
ncbi:hypothetical protein FQN54_008377 [Arachnomyces sp. PD_36]|nr:hypothetical protein FQN54_008377 [Arachnomyces sp. PD_36]